MADPEIEKRGALPPDRAIPGIVRMRIKFIRAHGAKRTERKGGAQAPWAPPPGSATGIIPAITFFLLGTRLSLRSSLQAY